MRVGPRNQMSWKEIKRLALRLGVRLGFCGPAPSQSSSLLHKGEPNEAWGRNYTNANWQMSCIVPGYNKQYGCLSWISMRKGGAFWRLCFDCCFFFGEFYSSTLFLLGFISSPFSEKRYFRTGAIKSLLCFQPECLSTPPGYFRSVLWVLIWGINVLIVNDGAALVWIACFDKGQIACFDKESFRFHLLVYSFGDYNERLCDRYIKVDVSAELKCFSGYR